MNYSINFKYWVKISEQVQIGKKEGLALLKEWIDSSNDTDIRQNALINYGLIDEGKNFKYFEQLFLSDEDIRIRLIAGEILKDKYTNNKRLIPLLDYTLKKIAKMHKVSYDTLKKYMRQIGLKGS